MKSPHSSCSLFIRKISIDERALICGAFIDHFSLAIRSKTDALMLLLESLKKGLHPDNKKAGGDSLERNDHIIPCYEERSNYINHRYMRCIRHKFFWSHQRLVVNCD